MSAAATPVLRRINGRLQACDPCRSRKVRGSWTPMYSGMRPYPSSLFEMQEEETRQALFLYSFFHDSRDSAVRPGPGFVHGLSIRPLQCQCNSTRLSLAQPEHREVNTGEQPVELIEETLSILNGHPEDACHSPCMEDCPVTISSKTLALGVTILRHVPYPEDGHRLFRKEATIYDGWIRVVTRRILDSFYDEWGSYLGRNRSLPKLEEMARRICVNTAKSVAKKVDANEWLDQFRGPNLRWESLGLMFNYWDLLDKLNEIQYPAGHVPLSYYAPTTQESIMLCLEMAQEYSDGNPFTVHLSLRRAVLESLISGDASRQTWKFLADAVASLTFLGMHAEPFDDSYQPTFYSEISRRVLLPVFTIDKVQLAFTGRPPLLFRKFITTPMPLDIKDEDLFLDQKSLIEKVRTTVDDKGWNTEGGFYSVTYIRARYIMAQFREQIAEIALGNDRQATVDDLLQIKAKQDAVESEFPSVLLWRQEDVTEPGERTTFMFPRLLLKLDMLQNDFFLYRLLLRRGSPDEGSLLYTSFQMVSLVLNLWTHMDRFSKMRPDFEWLLIGYGASPGGILCKCLLKTRSSQIHPSEPDITRSTVIQKLSLLVGFFDWVSPSAPNAELCKDCKSVIERVLDQALNNTPGEMHPFLDNMNMDFSTQLDFNFELMDTFDWLRSDFETSEVA
ncbi:hypothetical protein SUNI508_11118 [Seiridium unicorne]|uniref:Xylanolytic transcriptional activator regulatory domain-containing protein n=1 Tax=Seiridium unicorne TaxID=138068 RepID=A0ABR2UIU6_9PEZI